jgi:hypothetical protein
MDRTSLTYSGARPTMSTKFCADEACLPAGGAADQVRTGRQPDYGDGARLGSALGAAHARRRGDRVEMQFVAVQESPHGTKRQFARSEAMSGVGGEADLPVARPDFSV